MGKLKCGWKFKRSDEEYAWARELYKQIALTGMKVSRGTYKELDAFDSYKKKFGKDITAGQLGYMIKKVSGLRGKTKEQKNIKKLFLTLESSKYILYVFNEGIYGFPTKDEVKTYLTTMGSNVPVTLFENIPVKVKHSVEVTL